jgi:hypothetical protein
MMRALYAAVLLSSLALNVAALSAVVRLEKYHYANSVGFCREVTNVVDRDRCLSGIETRTNPIWHILYGLRIL